MAETKTQVETICKKCPKIEGHSYCKHKRKTIWREDEMCEDGYLFRIERGVDMIARTDAGAMDENGNDKCEAIYQKVLELERIWREKFYGKEKKNGAKQRPIEPVSEPELPF